MSTEPGSERELRDRSLRGGSLMIVSHAFQFVVGVGAVMILARLLTPRDFGLFAMASFLFGLVRSIRDFGLPMAVVHEEGLEHAQLSALFWVNLRLNAIVAVATLLLAPAAAWFFAEPTLVAIVVAIAASAFVHGLANLHLGILRREFRFRAVAAMEIAALVAGAVAAVALAWQGAGVWALVAQQAVALILQAALLFHLCSFRPSRGAEAGSADLRSMLRFGREATYARVLGFLGRELDRALVGRFTDAAALGLYASAQRWSAFPVRQLYLPLLGVVVSGMSRLRHEPGAYRGYAEAAFLAVLAPALPALAFLAVCADDVVRVLLGEQWLDAIPIFRVLAVGAFFGSTTRLCKWIYLSEGRTRRQLHWTLLSTPVMIAGMASGLPWGAIGVAVGYAAATIALAGPAMVFALSGSPLGRGALIRAAWRPAVAAVAAAAALAFLRAGPLAIDALVPRLLAHALAFGVLTLAVWSALPGGIARLREIATRLADARAS